MAKKAAEASALFHLRARWALFLLFGLLAILASRWLLNTTWLAVAVDAWAVLALAVFIVQLCLLWFDLPKNVSVASRRLLPGFGPGTWLSLLRVLALAMLAGFLWPPRPAGWLAWSPFVLHLMFNLADLADGYAARVSGTKTRLGQKLDLDLDGRGLLIAALLAMYYGVAGWWYLLVGLARYLFVFAAWVHRWSGRTFKLHPNALRRPLAGAQMGIGVALLAPQLPTVLTIFVSTLSMFPFVGNFIFDWLAAAGWLRIKKSLRRSKQWQGVANWGLLVGRVALALLIILRVSGEPLDFYFVLDIFLGLLLLLGLAGRTAAFALLVEIGFRLQAQVLQPPDFAILFVGVILLYLGTGEFSYHPLREGWVFRHWGAERRA